MPKTKISEFSSTPANNTDIDSINISEGCAPSGINDAIRELMAQLKDWQSGTSNDPYVVGSSGSLTLNQGTANTVPYLNGSKVVTSGTALTFDGTNLGLGVTPSAWASGEKVVQLLGTTYGGGIFASGGNVGTIVGSNAYYSSTGYKRINTAASSALQFVVGETRFLTAGSGAADSALTLTQAMTLDASGNLGIGTTSALGKFHVRGTTAANMTCRLEPYDNNYASKLLVSSQSSGDGGIQYGASGANNLDVFAYDAIKFSTGAISGSVGTERARIDSSGNLLVGTTSSNTKLDVRQTNNSYNATYFAHSGASQSVSVLDATSSSYASGVLALDSYTASGTGWKFLSCYSGGFASERLFIRGDGNVYNVNGTYGAISDVKLKENITDATSKLAQLNQVRVVNYNLIGDEQKQIGVIAQELEQIFPSMVDETPDKDAEGNELGTTTKAVKYSVFVPMLIKALQEQQAIIESLTTRITALEGAQA